MKEITNNSFMAEVIDELSKLKGKEQRQRAKEIEHSTNFRVLFRKEGFYVTKSPPFEWIITAHPTIELGKNLVLDPKHIELCCLKKKDKK